MRDIILSILAIALVTAASLAALQAGDAYVKANKRIVEQAGKDHATADQLKDWTAKLER